MGTATMALYLRIPAELRQRLESVASVAGAYRKRGDLQDTAIKALSAGLDALAEIRAHKVQRAPVVRGPQLDIADARSAAIVGDKLRSRKKARKR
jgi:hypothetical protein